MQQGCFMKAAAFLGAALIVPGTMLLAQCASSVDLLAKGLGDHDPKPVHPVYGGIFILSGIALLLVRRQRG